MMSKFMMFKLAFMAFLAVLAVTTADTMKVDKVENSTMPTISDMPIIDAETKTSTERPTVMDAAKQENKPASQRLTVADFIIHPLIAFKPRNPEDNVTAAAGKQANNTNGQPAPSTTPSPWQLFGFNAGQGLGSQVTNLAGQFSGWLNDRIQFPGLVETPVRESTTPSAGTTTTPRPDVVVRVQHKATTHRPLITIDRNRPNHPQFESQENDNDDEDDEDEDNDEDNTDIYIYEDNSDEATDDKESSNEVQESNGSEEDDEDQNGDEDEPIDDEEEEEHLQRPNNRRRPLRKNSSNTSKNGQRRRVRPQQQSSRRRVPSRRQQQTALKRHRPAAAVVVSGEDDQDDDEYVDNDDFYYGSRPSRKRSQSNAYFVRRGQQHLINQIRQFTRGQSPAEVGSAIRKAQRKTGANKKRREQVTLFVNRNGQTIYVAPELAQVAAPQYQPVYAQPIVKELAKPNAYPQPPLTVPLKRKGQPTQYITIPWSKLGISPPNNLVSVAEGIQDQPLILNIPQSAINAMQSQAISRPKKKHHHIITADAVPLLAEASLMDIFTTPQIPPPRNSSSNKPAKAGDVKPSSTKTSSVMLQQRMRPGTIVDKAPETSTMKKDTVHKSQVDRGSNIDKLRATGEEDFILVGNDNEPGLTRQAEPVFGGARYVRLTGNSQHFDMLPKRPLSESRESRELVQSAEMLKIAVNDKTEQFIPVQIFNEPKMQSFEDAGAQNTDSKNARTDIPVTGTILGAPRPAPATGSTHKSTDAIKTS